MPIPPSPSDLTALLRQSAALHGHLCPRQVLGVRCALRAAGALGLAFPRTDKRVLVFVETDGCFADGVSVASGCWLGRRTLRLMDYGKIAATFVDSKTGQAVRVAPQTDLRQRVKEAKPENQKRYEAYLHAYQTWPDEDLLTVQDVTLTIDLGAIVSVHGKRVICEGCGEEIINEREVIRAGRVLCLGCAGPGYCRGQEAQAEG